jgi:hypothetical protein
VLTIDFSHKIIPRVILETIFERFSLKNAKMDVFFETPCKNIPVQILGRVWPFVSTMYKLESSSKVQPVQPKFKKKIKRCHTCCTCLSVFKSIFLANKPTRITPFKRRSADFCSSPSTVGFSASFCLKNCRGYRILSLIYRVG